MKVLKVNVTPKSRSERWPIFDLLRGVAILGVIIYHSWVPFFRGGYLGVDVFFAISGFLLTYIFLSQKDDWLVSRFLYRRAARILPPLFFVLLVCGIFYWAMVATLPKLALQQPLLVFASAATSWLNLLRYSGVESGFLSHMWSLSLEEQFYLLLAIAFVFFRKKIFLLFIFASGIWLYLSLLHFTVMDPSNWVDKGYASDRAQTLFLGVMAGIFFSLKENRIVFILDQVPRRAMVFFQGLLICGLFSFFQLVPFILPPVWGDPLIGMFTVLVIFLIFRSKTEFRFLPLEWIGRRSYSIYLWHWPVQSVLANMQVSRALKAPLFFLVTGIAAEISYRWIEGSLGKQGFLLRQRKGIEAAH